MAEKKCIMSLRLFNRDQSPFLVRLTGFEPLASGVGVRVSKEL